MIDVVMVAAAVDEASVVELQFSVGDWIGLVVDVILVGEPPPVPLLLLLSVVPTEGMPTTSEQSGGITL